MNQLATIPTLKLSGKLPTISLSPEAEKQKKALIASSSKIIKVDSHESSELAREELRAISTYLTQFEKDRVMVKEPFLEGGRTVDSLAKGHVLKLKLEKDRVSGLVTSYAEKKEMERRAAEMEARRLAEEAERKEAEAELARIAAEETELRRFEEMESGKKKAAEAARLEALKKQREAEMAEAAEEKARAAAMSATMEAMSQPVQGTRSILDFEVENIDRVNEVAPHLVKKEVRRREMMEHLALQRERGLPVGMPGIKVIEVFKTNR